MKKSDRKRENTPNPNPVKSNEIYRRTFQSLR